MNLFLEYSMVGLASGGMYAARAWWSLLSLLAVFAVTLAAELIANDKPLLVRYEHEWIVPMLEEYASLLRSKPP